MAPSDIPAEGSRVEMQVEGPAGETQHTGVILPPADTGFVSLKLDNGYNVSHPLSNIISLKLLAEAIPRVETENGELGLSLKRCWPQYLNLPKLRVSRL